MTVGIVDDFFGFFFFWRRLINNDNKSATICAANILVDRLEVE